MDGVYARRCNACHARQRVRIHTPWRSHRWGELGIRVENPHLNAFLLAPLAKAAGGTQRCGQPVFAAKEDPDYQAVLQAFKPIHDLIKQRPRMDMPGAQPAPCCRVARSDN